MRDQEIVGLWEAYSSIYQKDENEFETWVNDLVEEGYDLSDYTWNDMYEMFMNLDEGDGRAREGSRFDYNQEHGRPLLTPQVTQSRSSQETLGGGTYQRGPKRLPRNKSKYDKQVLSGVRAASEQEKQRARQRLGIRESYDFNEALTGSRLSIAKQLLQGLNPKSPRARLIRNVADSQEGSNRGDTVPGNLPSDRSNTTLPTKRGGRGRKGLGKTTNRPGLGAPLGGWTSETDRGSGNKNRRRRGEVEDTRESYDFFDYILEHLIAEGYADTNDAALSIMANMSEEWKQSIVEAQHARENPEEYEREQRKKTAPVRGERTPMPPRGDKRREDFEKWYRANVR